MHKYILAIETSCDDTGVAIIDLQGKLISNIIARQFEIHAPYGGVMPVYAAQAHLGKLPCIAIQALQEAKITSKEIIQIAYTEKPGLAGALITGKGFATGLAKSWHVPLLGINHLHAHSLSVTLEHDMKFPYLSLVVSGGNTLIHLVKSPIEIETINQTLDDAGGEVLDKIGRMLGLDWPGGPNVEKLAKKSSNKFKLPIPKCLSYSGLKSSALRAYQQGKALPADIAFSLQHALFTSLIEQLELTMDATGISQTAITGGVACNATLRKYASKLGSKFPSCIYCTDNAAMIANAAYLIYLNSK